MAKSIRMTTNIKEYSEWLGVNYRSWVALTKNKISHRLPSNTISLLLSQLGDLVFGGIIFIRRGWWW